jgi:ABC-2 type transport system ATP-binding protein
MEEAEELSDRVGIIDQGRLIAVGTQAELTRVVGQQETLRLHLAEEAGAALAGANGADTLPAGLASADGSVELFAGLPGVLRASAVDHQIVVNVVDAGAALPAVVGRANSGGLHVRSIDIEQPNLEAVFLHLTGRGLRD